MVSILIINYKTYELTKNTITSLVDYTSDVAYEIILLDNASGDGSIERLERDFEDLIRLDLLKVVKNPKNGGFSYGTNIGIDHAKGDVVVLVNSDIEVKNNIIKNIDVYIKSTNHRCILGPKIILPDGNFEHGCKRGFPTPKTSLLYFFKLDKRIQLTSKKSYRMHEVGMDETGEVDAISGAFMAVPKKIINRIGKLDETFFMYGEDIDWCYRAKKNGFKVVYKPDLGTVVHHHGQSGKKIKWKVLFEFYRAMYIFHKKHYASQYNVFINILVYLGIFSMYSIKAIKNMISRG